MTLDPDDKAKDRRIRRWEAEREPPEEGVVLPIADDLCWCGQPASGVVERKVGKLWEWVPACVQHVGD